MCEFCGSGPTCGVCGRGRGYEVGEVIPTTDGPARVIERKDDDGCVAFELMEGRRKGGRSGWVVLEDQELARAGRPIRV